MSKNELEPGDFHVAVRRREHTLTLWRCWAAVHTKAVEQSKCHYATMTEAMREGKAASKALLQKHFPDGA